MGRWQQRLTHPLIYSSTRNPSSLIDKPLAPGSKSSIQETAIAPPNSKVSVQSLTIAPLNLKFPVLKVMIGVQRSKFRVQSLKGAGERAIAPHHGSSRIIFLADFFKLNSAKF
jgi:hypothetical protein